MAEIFTAQNEFGYWAHGGGSVYSGDNVFSYPYARPGGVPDVYVQKVWDTVAGSWVRWETDDMDINGTLYPGPGTWGVHTSDYRVETIKYSRSLKG